MISFNSLHPEKATSAYTPLREDLFNSDDPALITKKFWAHVKYQSNSCRIPNRITYGDQLCFNPKEQAEHFNTYF